MKYLSTKQNLPWKNILCRRLECKTLTQNSYSGFLNEEEFLFFSQLSTKHSRQFEWLAGRIAMKETILQWLNDKSGPKDIHIKQDESGKPYFTSETQSFVPDISISHSHGVAIAALSLTEQKIGIDYEDTSERRLGNWLQRAFSDNEITLIKNSAYSELINFWMAKEASAKALGSGFNKAWRSWEVISKSGDTICVKQGDQEYIVKIHQKGSEIISLCLK